MRETISGQSENLLSSVEAGRRFGYTNDYVARLAREGRIEAERVGRQWYVDQESLGRFIVQAEASKRQLAARIREERKLELSLPEEAKRIPILTRLPLRPRRTVLLETGALMVVGALVGAFLFVTTPAPKKEPSAVLAHSASLFERCADDLYGEDAHNEPCVPSTTIVLDASVGNFLSRITFGVSIVARELWCDAKSWFTDDACIDAPKLATQEPVQTEPPAQTPTPTYTTVAGDTHLTQHITNPVTLVREYHEVEVDRGGRDTVKVVRYESQVDRIYDDLLAAIADLSRNIGESFTTELLTVSGNTSLAGTLTVAGNTNLQGTLQVAGDTTLTTLTAQHGTSTTLYTDVARGTDLFFTNATSTNLFATNLGATTGTITSLSALSASGLNLAYANAAIGTAIISAANITQASSTNIYTDRFVALAATTTDLHTTRLSVDSFALGSGISSHFVPSANDTYDLGSPSFYWRNGYIDTITVNNISAASTSIGGTASNSFTVNSDNATANLEDMHLIFYRGAVVPNAVLAWDSTEDRFEFNQPAYIENQSGSTTQATLTLRGLTGQTGNLFQIASSTGQTIFSVASNGSVTIATTTITALTTGTSTITNLSVTNLSTSTFAGGIGAGSLGVSGPATFASILTVSGLADFQNGFVARASSTVAANFTTTGQNIAAAGTVGAPSYSFSNDLNTGMWSSGADTLAFSTGGSERLTINSSGNVGIGTTTPSTKLGVLASGGTEAILVTAGSGIKSSAMRVNSDSSGAFWVFDGTSTGNIASNYTTDAMLRSVGMYGWTSSATSVGGGTLDTALSRLAAGKVAIGNGTQGNTSGTLIAGSIGIGTTSPMAALSLESGQIVVPSSSATMPSYSFASSSAIGFYKNANGSVLFTGASGNQNIFSMNYNGATIRADATLGFTNGNSADPFVQASDISIGRNAANVLEVNNGARVAAGGSLAGLLAGSMGIGTTTPFAKFSIAGASLGTTPLFAVSTSTASATSTAFIIDSTGKVGIGTAAPASTLEVRGTITATDGARSGFITDTGLFGGRTNNTNGQFFSMADGNGSIVFTANVSDDFGVSHGGPGRAVSFDAAVHALGSTGMRFGSSANIFMFGPQSNATTVAQTLTTTFSQNNRNGKDFLIIGGNTVGPQAVTGGDLYLAGGNGSGGGADGDVILTYPGAGTVARGNVGIGTTSPGSKLVVSGSTASYVTEVTDGTVRLSTYIDPTSGQFGTRSNHDLHLFTNNSGRLSITSAGNVGIGTTSPSATFSVTGSGYFTGGLGVGIVNTAAGTLRTSGIATFGSNVTVGANGGGSNLNVVGDGVYSGFLRLQRTSGVNAMSIGYDAPIAANAFYAENTRPFSFLLGNLGAGTTTPWGQLSASSTSANPALAIQQNGAGPAAIFLGGNVGIGTTTPGYKLTVSGTSGIHSATQSALTFMAANNSTGFSIGRSAFSDNNNDFFIFDNASSATRLAINSSGNVGIGSSTPSAKLSVLGTASTTGAAPFALYVQGGSGGQDESFNGAAGGGLFLRGGTGGVGGAGGFTEIYGGNGGQGGLIVGGSGGSVYISGGEGGGGDTDGADGNVILTLNRSGTAIGNVGIGTTSPTAQLTTTGTVRFSNFGAGTLQTDANGNVSVSSDEGLKNIEGQFEKGLEAILTLEPINFTWKDSTGFDTANVYTGFSAQNVKLTIPEAVGEDKHGFLTLSERPILRCGRQCNQGTPRYGSSGPRHRDGFRRTLYYERAVCRFNVHHRRRTQADA